MTEKLYLDNSYLFEFNSEVKSVTESDSGVEVLLSQTAFYPDAGGQPCDIGKINNIPVKHVYENDDNEIVHTLESADFSPGDLVHGIIDSKRRLDNMRAHTGQHILSQAFIRIAGVETISAHMGLDESTVDLAVKSVNDDEIHKAEEIANKIVMENLAIQIGYHNRDELEALSVRRIPDRDGKFRVVKIGDFEITACGGTHCANTGEVGIVKILRTEKIRGNTRIIFLTGFRSLKDYDRKHSVISELSGKLTCHFEDIPDSITKLGGYSNALKKEIASLNSRLFEYEIDSIIHESHECNGLRIVSKNYPDNDLKIIRERTLKLADRVNSAVMFMTGGKLCIAVSKNTGLNAGELAKILMGKIGGKGGGNRIFAQIGGIDIAKTEDILNTFVEIVKNEIAGL